MTRSLPVLPLVPKELARFGRVVAPPSTAPDATGPGFSWWAETTTLAAADRPYGIGVLALEPTDLAFSWAERHWYSEELIVAGTDVLVYVGPHDAAGFPSLEAFRVFAVPAGHGVLLGRGVWHGAPLAIERPGHAVVLLLEGTGTSDTEVVRFEDTPVTIDTGSLRHARR